MAKHFGPQKHPEFTTRQMKQVLFRLPHRDVDALKEAVAKKGLTLQEFLEEHCYNLIREEK